jgi:23S rRNA (cytidine1920-2'-O)/16S rRNA (cytidine1409-2'-O)-methyltransferase
MKEKKRLDVLLFEKGLAESRQKAQTLVMSGLVFVDGKRETKSGAQLTADAVIEVKSSGVGFVSRGGLKLQKALDVFGVDPKGLVALDSGASTGGFTDCLLKRGASKVYAIDVGYGQLDWKLRQDPRVVCMERTNLRYVTRKEIPESVDLATLDLSFISLRLVLPAVRALLGETGQVCCLIKPQFEAGRENVGKKGVVRDPEIHRAVLEHFLEDAKACGFFVQALSFSPVRGPEGNIEFLGHLRVEANGSAVLDQEAICSLVEQAHSALQRG